MAEQPKKILEISGQDWMGGISIHPYMPVGGTFKSFTNFDPYQKVGVYVPTQSESRIGVGTISTNPIRWMVSFTSTAVSGVSFFYAFGDNKELYTVRTTQGALYGSPNSGFAINHSSRLTWSGNKGAIKYKDRIVFMGNTGIAAGTIPLPTVPVHTILLSNLTNTYAHVPHIGPDRNLYVTNKSSIAKVTSVTGTTGNIAQFLTFESDIICRDITDDGQHLIIVGDANSANDPNGGLAVGEFRCFVAFWNMKSQEMTRVWEFKDNSVYGVEVVEDEVVILGRTNTYKCSVNSRPSVIMPKGQNSNIVEGVPEPGSVVKAGDTVILWAEGANDQVTTVYGYGRIYPSLPKRLFKAHIMTATSSQTETIFSMLFDRGVSNNLFAGYGNELYVFSTPNNTSTCTLAGIDFKQPYEFSFAKVILSDKLTSGQSVDLEILSDSGNTTVLRHTGSTDSSFSFTNVGGKKSHIFYPAVAQSGSTIGLFEDLSDITIRNVGASIRRVEIWGKPVRPDQNIYM